MNRSERRKVGKTQKADVDHLVQEGLNRMQEGQFGSARNAFREVISVQPNNGEALYRLGTLSYFAGELAQAEDLFRRSIVARPGHAEAHYDLGFLLQQFGRFDEALKSIRSAIDIDPTRPEFHVGVASVYRYQAKLDDAIAATGKALELDPKNPRALFYKGMNDISRNDKDAAIQSFASVLESDPQMREAYIQLASLEYDPAIEDSHLKRYNEAFEAHPDDVRIALMFTEALHKSGKFEDVEKILRKFESLEGPGSLGVANGLAYTLASQGKYDEAVPFHKKAIQIDHDDAVTRQSYGTTLLQKGQYKDAEAQFQKAWQRQPYAQDLIGVITATLRANNDAQAKIFTNPDLLVHEESIDTPNGFSDVDSFNSSLWATIEAIEEQPVHPFEKNRRLGSSVHTIHIGTAEDPTLVALREAFYANVASFMEVLPDNKSHPFLSRKDWTQTDLFCVAFASSAHEAKDFAIENTGFMKGYYFVSVPEECSDEVEKPGWLRLGKPNIPMKDNLGPEVEIEPEAGKIVLFPAYFWQGFNALKAKSPLKVISFHLINDISRKRDSRT